MAGVSALTADQISDLRQLFDLFDADGDGLLEVEEISTIWASCGLMLTEAEVCQRLCPGSTVATRLTFPSPILQVLDMVTELKPDLRKLPFDEFVNMMCLHLTQCPS